MAKYSKGAGNKVEEAMHEMKRGELKSGRTGKKVTSRKQAIAIGLSEARERGAKVPKKASKSSGGGRSKGGKKAASKNLLAVNLPEEEKNLLLSQLREEEAAHQLKKVQEQNQHLSLVNRVSGYQFLQL